MVNKNNLKQIYNFQVPIPSNITLPFPISTISYSNNLTGNISFFSNYLDTFEKLPYFTKIEGFTISSQSKNGWSDASNISYNAIIYAKTIE